MPNSRYGTGRHLISLALLFTRTNAFTLQRVELASTRHHMQKVPIDNQMAKDNDDNGPNSFFVSRRLAVLRSIAVMTAPTAVSSVLFPSKTFAADDESNGTKVHISTYWKAVDGLNSLDEGKQFVSFDQSAYRAMMDDPSRTPQFEKAIINRLNSAPGGPESQVVLDLGTGPFALFAIIAAQAGAGKVYAIEANKEAAKSARAAVKQFGFEDVITILDRFSSDISLPNNAKADFAVAEIVGSIASEEGAFSTILDAHRRLVKEPNNPSSWIPNRIQTFAAPAAYTLHNLFQPPAFDWSKLDGEPVRFNCRDQALQLLADPVVVEDISFAEIKPSGVVRKDISFTVDEDRINDNIINFYEALREARLGRGEAEKVAKVAGRSFSGIAFWPRLILDAEGKIEVNSRSYPNGGHQKSHWQTVLPIMCDVPISLKAGDEVAVNINFDVSDNVLKPSIYKVDGNLVRK